MCIIHSYHAGALVYVNAGEVEVASNRIELAVLEVDLDCGAVLAVKLDLACLDGLLEVPQVNVRLSEINIYGIDLLDGGEGRALVRGHKRALGYRGLADDAGDGSVDSGVLKIDLGVLERCLRGENLGCG